MPINGGTIVSYLELDMSKYSTALKMAKTQAGVLGNGTATAAQKLVGLGNAAQIVGSRLTLGVTAPIIGLGFAATKSAITQESAFAGVRKTVDATVERYGELQSALRKMSTDKPTNFSGLSGIMEISGQLGVSERYIEKFTGTMADLEQTTDLTGESAATMMAQYANVSGMSLNNIDRLGSTVVELGNNTATTESKIVGFMQNLSGMAKLLNLSDPDVAGLSATLASLGLEDAGASSINRTMQTMQQAVLSGGAALNTFAATAGMSAEAFAASFRGNSMQALDQFVTGLGRMRAEGGNVYAVLDDLKLDDIRVTDTLLRLSSAEGQLAANTEMANEAWQKNTALTDEASKRYETTESQLQMAKNSLSNAGARIGEAFTPMLARGANVVADIAEGFAGMSDTAKDATVGLGMTAAAAGPLLKIGGGLVKVLAPMGPAGWIALGVAAAAGGIYLLAKNAAEADRALTKAQLAKRFGEITLSAEEMDSILEANFERNPWTSVLQDRMAAIEDSAKTISGLNKQIDKTLFMASVGVDTAELQNLPSLVDQQVSATQRMLQDERYACTIAVRAVYGDSEEGGELIKDFNTYFSGLDAEAAAAGEAVKKAFISAIADGDVSAEEARAIEAMRQKQAEITQKAMLLETESTKTLLKTDANHMELTPESIAGLAERSKALLDAELQNADINCDTDVYLQTEIMMEQGETQAAIDAEVTKMRDKCEENKQEITLRNISLNFDLYGKRTMGAFDPEIKQLASSLDDAWSSAFSFADEYLKQRPNIIKGSQEYADTFAYAFQEKLSEEIDVMRMPEDSVRKQAAVMWKALEPDYEALKASTAGMENIPAEYVQMMNWYEGMRRLTLERDEMFGSLGENIDGVTGTMESAGEGAAQSAAEGADSKTDSFSTAGANAGGGFVSGLLGTVDAAAAAGAAVAGAALGSMRQTLQIHSPSRVTRQDGRYTGQGLALGLIDTKEMAYQAGSEVSAAALRGIEDTAQIHSPSKVAVADGKNIDAGIVIGLLGSLAAVENAARFVEQQLQAASRQAAAQAQADAAAAAERQRQQQLKALKDQGAALIAQDAKNHQRRMKAYTTQWNAMMAMAGANAVWYQDTPLEKEQAKVKQRYDLLLEQLEEQHEAQMAKLKKNGDEEQKQAAEEAYRDRIAALKDQQSEELDMLQQQYDAQRDLADRLVTAQQNSLQARLDQMNEQRTQEDLQKQLADLEKQKRQSKSAREKRELQEQIDELNRNEELRQAQLQINNQMDMWDRVREAINAGVIGLGDLTGDTSLPTVANGQGLSAIPDLTSSDLKDILAALSQTVTPVANSKAGNHYAIDLRGAVVRDDNDIRTIVDMLDERLRSASR